MLKHNATAFLETENILFGLKYEELVANSMSSKNRSSIIQEGNYFQKAPFLEPEEIGGEDCS